MNHSRLYRILEELENTSSLELERLAGCVHHLSDFSAGQLFHQKLYKLLFLSDLLHLRETGKQLTPLKYDQDPAMGPMPRSGDILMNLLSDKGLIKKNHILFPATDYYGIAYERISDQAPAQLEEQAIDTLKSIIEAYKKATSRMLVDECSRLEIPPELRERKSK